ncbi:MAG: phage neck terminator protein [Janthinobacterium lividum]
MANDSSTGGYLAPVQASPPLEDDELVAVFQGLIVGLTGLDGSLVRPRWQPTVPKQPEPSVNWCAIGVTLTDPDANPVMRHNSVGQGSDSLLRHEILTVLASFYGPNGMRYGAQARDGLYVGQNRAALYSNSMGLVNVGQIRTVPELINQQWIRRYDLEITIRRQVVRTYEVLNVLSAAGTVDSDPRTIPFSVSQ